MNIIGPDGHPISAEPSECRVCGCTGNNACVLQNEQGVDVCCWWVEPDLCSGCSPITLASRASLRDVAGAAVAGGDVVPLGPDDSRFVPIHGPWTRILLPYDVGLGALADAIFYAATIAKDRATALAEISAGIERLRNGNEVAFVLELLGDLYPDTFTDVARGLR